MSDSEKKLSPLDYQTYKLRTNPKDEKLAVCNLVVKYHKVGTPEEWLEFMEAIVQVIKGQDIQDGDAVYSLVKSLLKGMLYKSSRMRKQVKMLRTAWHLLNALRLSPNTYSQRRHRKHRKRTSKTSINDYLVHLLVPDGVTVMKISCAEFVGVLEDGILYQWKLQFKKE
eukprot:2408074-Ditylum_brightwellii.AAC.1